MPDALSQEIKNSELLNSFVLKEEIFDKNLIILVDQSNICLLYTSDAADE